MTYRTEPQMKDLYIRFMGAKLGEVFHYLIQEAALLHLKWNEYVTLFGKDKEQIDVLNSAAVGFFWLVEGRRCGMTCCSTSRAFVDRRRDVLTVQSLPKLAPAEIRAGTNDHVKTLDAAASFARDWRNRRLAHRNIDIALSRPVTPLEPASRENVNAALAALDDLLFFVEHAS